MNKVIFDGTRKGGKFYRVGDSNIRGESVGW
jgi:hypothetical protein